MNDKEFVENYDNSPDTTNEEMKSKLISLGIDFKSPNSTALAKDLLETGKINAKEHIYFLKNEDALYQPTRKGI